MLRPLLVILLLLLLAGSGCREPTATWDAGRTCAALHQRMWACDLRVSADPDAFQARCAQYPEDFAALVRCTASTECPAFRACVAEAGPAMDAAGRRARRLERLEDRIAYAESSADWARLEELCALRAVDPDPGPVARKVCGDLSRRAATALIAEIESLRDAPTVAPVHLERCDLLLHFAGKMSAADVTAVRALCHEAALSVEAHGLLERVHEEAESPNPTVPWECEPALTHLREVDTRPIRRAWTALVTACYVTIGRKILSAADASTCPPGVRRVLDGLVVHELTELDALAIPLREACAVVQ